MAQIDFSNAHIECLNSDVFIIMPTNSVMFPCLGLLYPLTNEDGSQTYSPAINNANIYNLNADEGTCSIIRTGTFTQSGNEMYIRKNASPFVLLWKITNIEFETGDTFSFQIDVKLT